jgi:Icc-related predicted phosphoesterase
MKIIAVGDIHMTTENLARNKAAAEADLLILNGDLTNYGSISEVRQVLDQALAVNPSLLAQFGNLDKPEVNEYLQSLGLNLHNQARLLNNRACLIGVGGSNFTPFGTPSEYSENELGRCAQNAYEQARAFIDLAEPIEKIKIPLILVSHTPPYDTAVDRLADGRSVGSTAIRSFIEAKQPDLCIAGHIHEAAGMDLIGRTRVCNPGMLRRGGWLEIIIEKSELSVTLHHGI